MVPMTSDLSGTEQTTQRNIPAGLIEDARKHVYEAAIRTPLVRLNYDGPAEIYLKLECLQPIGSFKIRGAYNAVRLLPEEQRRHGVWTISAGNAAQGVALAARKLGTRAVIVMPVTPTVRSRSFTSSSLYGLMIASIFFMSPFPSQRRICAPTEPSHSSSGGNVLGHRGPIDPSCRHPPSRPHPGGAFTETGRGCRAREALRCSATSVSRRPP